LPSADPNSIPGKVTPVDAINPAPTRRQSSSFIAEHALVMGDIAAAEKLRNRYAGALRSMAERMLGDEGEAARVVESAFEEACTGWPPERGQVQVWLKRLVRRRAWARRRLLLGFGE
jgi:hypothetical protein